MHTIINETVAGKNVVLLQWQEKGGEGSLRGLLNFFFKWRNPGRVAD